LFYFFHFSFIIHMCIQGLVHFSPAPTSLTPTPPGPVVLLLWSRDATMEPVQEGPITHPVLLFSFIGNADKLLHIQIEDSVEANLTPFFRHICHFMDIHLELGSVVLVFSTRGISRSCAAVVAFLMHRNEETAKKSWTHVKMCKNDVRPNRGLVTQLLDWEKIVLGVSVSNVLDLLS
uniref:Tyrosine-protein phosphatase domain-containing protein n=2 Tax=Castor canadensis TaxID=51338 RepID=A0A8C0W7I3_CASCN